MRVEDIIRLLNKRIDTYRANHHIDSKALLVPHRTVEQTSSITKALKAYRFTIWYVDRQNKVKKPFLVVQHTSSLGEEKSWEIVDMQMAEMIINIIGQSNLFEQVEKGEYNGYSDEQVSV